MLTDVINYIASCCTSSVLIEDAFILMCRVGVADSKMVNVETGSLGNVTDECTEMYILNIT